MNIDFDPSTGWFCRWKRRYNIAFKLFQASANETAAASFQENQLQSILKKYKASNIFNADETALFYKALPRGTMAEKCENVPGEKVDKSRLTLLFITNMDGSEKYCYSIGKAKNPRCFKNKTLPIPYFSNSKGWMTSSIWTDIMIELNLKLVKQNRQIVMVIDNAASHVISETKLTNIEFIFLPPNTTSLIQPLDKGIIRCFKMYYRQEIIRKQILAIQAGKNNKEFAQSISVFKAMQLVKTAWWLVKPQSIKNCFRKCGFSAEFVTDNDEEDVCEIFESGGNLDEYIDIDRDEECEDELTDEMIIDQVLKNNDININEEETTEIEEEIVDIVSKARAAQALHDLRTYYEQNGYNLQRVSDMEKDFLKTSVNVAFHQRKITEFFTKNN